MKKSDQHELMRLGARSRLLQLQQHIAELHDEFPEEFATPFAPTLLKMDEKPGGNSWPAFAVSVANNETEETNGVRTPVSKKTIWTPERRAAASKRLKQQLRQRGPNVGGGQAWGTFQFQRIHDYLLTRPQRAASMSEMEKALKIVGSSVLSAITQHKELFRKTGIKGTYQLKKIAPASQRQHSNGPAKKATAHHKGKSKHSHPGARTYPKHWGDSVWHRLHDYLHDQQDQTATLIDIMKDNKINSHASAITSMQSHADIFERVKTGVYHLTRVLTDDEKKQYLKP